MFEDNATKAYMVFKGFNAIIFGENFHSNFDLVTSIFNIDTFASLHMLENIVTNYRNIIDASMKDNICRLVNYYRYDVDTFDEEERKEAIELCNSIVGFVNNSDRNDKKEKNKFLRLELKSRGFCLDSIMNYILKEDPEKVFKEIKIYNVLDFYILCTLTDVFSKEDYDMYRDKLTNPNVPTMYCITGIINEFPEILKHDTFREKLKMTTDLIKESIEKRADEIPVSKKVYKKEYRKYQNLVKKVCR